MSHIKNLVKRLIHKYKTNDPDTLCKQLNIIVIYKDLGKIRGIYQYDTRNQLIHVNNILDYHIQRQVLAHELGHAILHRKINTVFLDSFTYLSTDRIEIEANTFAAELLIGEIDPLEYEGYCLDQIAASLGVHGELLEYKIKALYHQF